MSNDFRYATNLCIVHILIVVIVSFTDTVVVEKTDTLGCIHLILPILTLNSNIKRFLHSYFSVATDFFSIKPVEGGARS